MTREEAIDCINAIHVQMFNSGNSKWTEACDMAIEALKEQRPHGEWIYHKGKSESRECSNCGVWLDWFMPRNSFCPNCGADMRKEGEGE